MINQEILMNFISKEMRISEFVGTDKSTNGFEISHVGKISKIALAVDACEATVGLAVENKADVLLVHHGFFWGNPLPLTGRHFRVVSHAVKNNLGVLALHLPLDMHESYGNNIGICNELQLNYLENVGNYKGLKLLLLAGPNQGEKISGEELLQRITTKLAPPLAVFGASLSEVKKVGICSGGGLSFLDDAVESGCNVLITGDANHTAYHAAKEEDITVVSCGHYASETLGVKSLGKALQSKFGVETVFLDFPTQL